MSYAYSDHKKREDEINEKYKTLRANPNSNAEDCCKCPPPPPPPPNSSPKPDIKEASYPYNMRRWGPPSSSNYYCIGQKIPIKNIEMFGELRRGNKNCIGADLTQLKIADDKDAQFEFAGSNLTGANLSGLNLSFSNFRNANLTGANLSKTNLTGAFLEGCVLTGANLTEANLTSADFSQANLSGADLTGANTTGMCLGYCYISETIFTNAINLQTIIVEDLSISGVYDTVENSLNHDIVSVKNQLKTVNLFNKTNKYTYSPSHIMYIKKPIGIPEEYSMYFSWVESANPKDREARIKDLKLHTNSKYKNIN